MLVSSFALLVSLFCLTVYQGDGILEYGTLLKVARRPARAADLASVEDLKARLPKLTHAHKQTLEYNEIMMALAAATDRPKNKMK
jgi:hypothetical protein